MPEILFFFKQTELGPPYFVELLVLHAMGARHSRPSSSSAPQFRFLLIAMDYFIKLGKAVPPSDVAR